MNISIIIPMYNAQAYIGDTLASLAQSIAGEYEVLIIDDGSQDGGAAICEAFIHAHPHMQIRLVRQANGGVSNARNHGIALAMGEYIAFFDADDLCKPGMHAHLLAAAQEVPGGADFCYCGYDVYEHTMQRVVRAYADDRYIGGAGYEVATAFAQDRAYVGITTALIRRSLVQGHGLRFTEGCRYGEDDEFTLKCLLCAKQVQVSRRADYCYRQTSNGATANVTARRFDNMRALMRVETFAKQNFPQHTDFLRAMAEQCIPAHTLNNLYMFAASGAPFADAMRCVREMGLADYMKKARGTRPTISAMILIYRMSPRLLYEVVQGKTQLSNRLARKE